MMKRALIIFLIATLCPATCALAKQQLEEVVQTVGLFALTDIQMSVGLSYEYSGHNSKTQITNSSTNHFKEKFHLGLGSFVLDPHLLSLRLDGDVWLDQSNTSRDTNGSQYTQQGLYQYSLTGSAFDRTVYPMYFISMRSLSTVVSQYSPTFTYDTTRNGLRGSFRNKYLPIWFSYFRDTYVTSGLGSDSSSLTDAFELQVIHDIGDISHTELTGNAYLQSVEVSGIAPSNSRNYSFSASNALYLDSRRKYTLGSSYTIRESTTGLIPNRTAEWTENLDCRFGKALRGNLNYRYNYDKTVGFNNQEQVIKSDTFRGSLDHRLFSSLNTTLTATYRHSDILGGYQSSYAGAAILNYQKTLPRASDLSLTFRGEREVSDRHVPGSLITVRDELHHVVAQGTGSPLAFKGTIVSVMSVRSRNPDITYVEGIDYRVNDLLDQIDIIFGGGIAPGTDLLISYEVRLDNFEKFSTDTYNATGILNLFANRYRILGNYFSQSFTPISGQNQQIGENDSRSVTIHLDANFLPNVFYLEYGDVATGPSKNRYGEGGWNFIQRFNLSSLTLKARDRYTLREERTAGNNAWENTAEAGVVYSRILFSWLNFSSYLSYVHSSGDVTLTDYVYFRANLQGRINKLFVNLVGQSIYRVRAVETTRDDFLRIELTRYF